MDFATAVKVCLSKYVDFGGRARRSEYWWFFLFTLLVSLVAGILDAVLGTSSSGGTGVIGAIASLALLLPSLAVGARRLHDTSRTGWWLLIGLIPLLGVIVLVVFWCQDSHADNKYGPSPKAAGTTYGPGPGAVPPAY